ncbi:SWIM zinc finger family protein, partial [Trichococcus sp.]|uniref:SWIM zinc finger family protein n=1 Tax=Trichococcus sp. TaxID=1985464 RepID=UPI003C7A78AB
MYEVEFDIQDIYDMTYSDVTYSKGKRLYESGTLRKFHVDSDGRYFKADVKGTKKYEVEVYLDEFREVEDYYCTCPAFENYDGLCKHLVAFLMAIHDEASPPEQEQSPLGNQAEQSNRMSIASGQQYDFEQTKRLLDVLQFELLQENDLIQRTPIQVEYTLIMTELRYGQHFSLKMRVGSGQLYMVKDCDYVIKYILGGLELPFGKKFTFSPVEHELSAEDRTVFLFLKQIIDSAAASGRDSRSSEDRKEITVPASMVKELLGKLSSCPLV